MNFAEKAGRGEMLANAPESKEKAKRLVQIGEIEEWFSAVVESENGEPPGLARYRRAVLENIEFRLRAKKVAIEKLLRDGDGGEHE